MLVLFFVPQGCQDDATNAGSAWTTKPIKQDVVYDDRGAVEKALSKLERLPPLVTPTEVSTLLPGLGLKD